MCSLLLIFLHSDFIIYTFDSIPKSLLAQPGDSAVLLRRLGLSIPGNNLGTNLALKEPRLLLYDIGKSLALKVRILLTVDRHLAQYSSVFTDVAIGHYQ